MLNTPRVATNWLYDGTTRHIKKSSGIAELFRSPRVLADVRKIGTWIRATVNMDNIRKQKGFLDGDPLGGTNSTISRKLKALYDSVKDEAIPDRFLDLLEQLDKAESKEGDEGRV